jgi:hypothetical protein
LVKKPERRTPSQAKMTAPVGAPTTIGTVLTALKPGFVVSEPERLQPEEDQE